MPQLSQSTILVGALLAAFVVWLAMNGRLNAYWSILTGSTVGATPQAGTSSTPPVGGLTGATTGATPGTGTSPPGGLASPGGLGGPLSITVHPLTGNIQY